MNRWELAALVFASAVCVTAAYGVGRQQGLRIAPDQVAYSIERDKELDAYMAEVLAETSGREMVCDRIFDLVLEEANANSVLEQEERSRE